MKNIRNKLTFKAITLREAAREKALALKAKALDTPARATLTQR